MDAKERHKNKIIEYIANPENRFPTRTKLAEVCDISEQALRKHFSTAMPSEIEAEGLELRRRCYIGESAKVDKGLIEKAAGGDSAACKLYYQKFEGWNEKKKIDLSGEVTLAGLIADLDKEDKGDKE